MTWRRGRLRARRWQGPQQGINDPGVWAEYAEATGHGSKGGTLAGKPLRTGGKKRWPLMRSHVQALDLAGSAAFGSARLCQGSDVLEAAVGADAPSASPATQSCPEAVQNGLNNSARFAHADR
jgi:hypothetical protein